MANQKVRTSFSLQSLKFGIIPDEGTMSTMLVDVGSIFKGTVKLTQADATLTDVFEEQTDNQVDQFGVKGARGMAFSLLDWTPNTLQSILGGSINAADGMWEEDDNLILLERSCQMITRSGILLEFPRVKIQGKLDTDVQTGAPMLIPVTATILKPDGAGVKSRRVGNYNAPTVSAGSAASVSTATQALTGTASAFRGTIVKQLWTVVSSPIGTTPTIATPTALTATLNGMTAVGDYKLQLAATDSNGFTSTATVTITKTA